MIRRVIVCLLGWASSMTSRVKNRQDDQTGNKVGSARRPVHCLGELKRPRD